MRIIFAPGTDFCRHPHGPDSELVSAGLERRMIALVLAATFPVASPALAQDAQHDNSQFALGARAEVIKSTGTLPGKSCRARDLVLISTTSRRSAA
jgi:hypothetical protein